MDHQDWKPVVFTKASKKKKIVAKFHETESAAKNRKLDAATDTEKRETISRETSQKLMQARIAKKLKQKDLATRLNLPVKVIQEIETAKHPLNKALYQKIARYLGILL